MVNAVDDSGAVMGTGKAKAGERDMSEAFAVNPAVLDHRHRGWRRMLRIEADGCDPASVALAVSDYMPAKLVYAVGDSWLAGAGGAAGAAASLLDAIRTPFLTAVIDASLPSLSAHEAVHGHPARRTKAMFNAFGFDAIVISIGGKDLIDAIDERAEFEAEARQAGRAPWSIAGGGAKPGVDPLLLPGQTQGPIDAVVRSILRFVDLRDRAGDAMTRRAPIFVNTYDRLQPRAAALASFSRAKPTGGPWLQPALEAAGLDATQMRRCVDAVVEGLHLRLAAAVAGRPDVHLIDQRGLLDLAADDAAGPDGDWLDEIHPSPRGFVKLARQRWDVVVSRALGWTPKEGDLVPAMRGH